MWDVLPSLFARAIEARRTLWVPFFGPSSSRVVSNSEIVLRRGVIQLRNKLTNAKWTRASRRFLCRLLLNSGEKACQLVLIDDKMCALVIIIHTSSSSSYHNLVFLWRWWWCFAHILLSLDCAMGLSGAPYDDKILCDWIKFPWGLFTKKIVQEREDVEKGAITWRFVFHCCYNSKEVEY